VYSRRRTRVARASEEVEAHRPPFHANLDRLHLEIALETASSRRTGARPVTEINGNATPTIDRRACIDVARSVTR